MFQCFYVSLILCCQRGLHISLSHYGSHDGLETVKVVAGVVWPGVELIFPGLVSCDLPTATLLVIILEIFNSQLL